jgi:outer membrane protein OmpA-like peptidoglycan-associated protein
MKVQGIVTKRTDDWFLVRDAGGVETRVLLTPRTEVTSHKKIFGKKDYSVTQILRGLRLQAQGAGDSEGRLVAEWVRFDEQDLRTAQALQQTDELARENQARVAAAEENARKLSQQLEENQALTAQAQASADAAQKKADAAMKAANMANNRINGLDDYDVVRTVSVLFAVNSSVLGPKGKATIDQAAAWAKQQNAEGKTTGWMVEVVGFADTTGNTAHNRSLSERRANTVIDYMVTKHGLPLERLIQPFGYGDSKPVANNATAAGRAQNRRVEIRVLQNKGIANTVQP